MQSEGVMQGCFKIGLMSNASINTMERKRHDLEFQLRLVKRMMESESILPYPFERAVILLRKEKRHAEAAEICRYVRTWCECAEAQWNGIEAMMWKSPKLQKIIRYLEGYDKQ